MALDSDGKVDARPFCCHMLDQSFRHVPLFTKQYKLVPGIHLCFYVPTLWMVGFWLFSLCIVCRYGYSWVYCISLRGLYCDLCWLTVLFGLPTTRLVVINLRWVGKGGDAVKLEGNRWSGRKQWQPIAEFTTTVTCRLSSSTGLNGPRGTMDVNSYIHLHLLFYSFT